MNYLFVNTAGAFAQDYKVYGFQRQGHAWDECTARPEDVLTREVPFSSKYTKETLHLGNRVRSFSIWIAKSENERKAVCAISLTGVSSANRRDFAGRIIFDSVAFIASLSGDAALDQSSLLESEAIATGLAQAASNTRATFDDFANLEDFERDLYPFSDVDTFYAGLVSSTSNASSKGPSKSDLVATDYMGRLLTHAGIPYKAVPLNRKGQPEACSDPSEVKSPANSRCDSSIPSMDTLVQKAENAAIGVEDGLTELFGEERASRVFAPFKKSLNAFLSEVKKSNPLSSRRSSRSAGATKPVSSPAPVESKWTLLRCSCGAETETLEKIIAGIFRAASESRSVALGLLVGDEGIPEIVEGIGSPPPSLVLISIRS